MNFSHLLLLFLILPLSSISAETKPKMLLSSQTTQFDKKENKLVFKKNIRLSLENQFKLIADEVTAIFDDEKQVKFFRANGNIILCSDDFFIIANELSYKLANQKLKIKNQSTFYHKNILFKGQNIIFNQKNRNISTQSSNKKKIEVIAFQKIKYIKQDYRINDGCSLTQKPKQISKEFTLQAKKLNWNNSKKELKLNQQVYLHQYTDNSISRAEKMQINLLKNNKIKLIHAQTDYVLYYKDDRLQSDEATMDLLKKEIELTNNVKINLKDNVQFNTEHALLNLEKDGFKLSSTKSLRIKIDE